MGKYFQEEIETASREKIEQIQTDGLLDVVKRVYENVPFYRKKMVEKGVTPDDIKSLKDISKLPFLTKDDLRDAYPYGLLAVPLKNCVRIHSTSGTTGKRVVDFYTKKDIDMWEDGCARALVAAGGTDEDVVHVAYGYGLFTGGFGLNGGSQKVGSLTLPMSSGNTDRQLQFMTDLGSTILCCTPSYASYLAESIEERGIKDQIKLKAGIFGAEAWSEDMRADIENRLGIKAYDIYGLTEIEGPGVAFECEEQNGMHICEDYFIPEIVDFYDESGQITDIKEEIATVYIRNFQTYIPFEKYLTEEYYYGDYTKMNTYLVNRYQIPLDLNPQIINPGINEIQYGNVQQVLDSLHGYLSVTVDAVNDLKVFPLDKLLASLEQYTIEFLSL